MPTSGTRRKALAAAFPYTIPILTGFGFLGFTYGIYMNVSGLDRKSTRLNSSHQQ